MHRLINLRQPATPDDPGVARTRLSASRRTRLRPRTLAVLGAIALGATTVAACAGSGGSGSTVAESTAASSDIAIVPTQQGSTANDIYPLVTGPQVTPYNEQDFQELMYRPLLWYGGQLGNEFGLNTQDSLASAPVYSHGDTVVTITMKKNFYWSDGVPVTARDVVFFFNLLVADKDNYGLYTPGEFPDNIKAVKTLSTYVVQFTLTKAYSPEWFNTNELGQITPFPQQVWDKTSATGKVGNYDETKSGAVAVNKFLISQAQSLNTYGTNPIWQVVDGPWRLKSFSTRGDIDLVPNTKYSGSPHPKLKELIERPYTSDAAEFNALLAGTGLTTGYVPTEDASQVKTLESDGYRTYPSIVYGMNYIVINFNSPAAGPLFRQLYIRQALQHLVNQPQDVKYAYNGSATPSYGPVPLAPKSPFTTAYERSNPYPFSTSAAQSLLASHGWKISKGGTDTCAKPGTAANECGAGIPAGKQLSIKILYASGDADYATMMENFQSAAKSVGVNIELSEGQFNQITAVTGVCKTGQSACNWEGVMYGGSTFGVYPTGNGFFNTDANGQGNYSSAEADTLINDTEYKAGLNYFYQYENYIAKNLPMIWMPWQQYDNSVVLKNLRGYTADQDNPFADTFPENWYYAK
jgi:peptide/nickel transport system substrate-binding protein